MTILQGIEAGFEKAFQTLFQLGAAYVVYAIAQAAAEQSKATASRFKCHLVAVAASIVFGAIAYSDLGTHRDEDSGEVVQDFRPTQARRVKECVFAILIVETLGAIGVEQGLNRKRRAPADRATTKMSSERIPIDNSE